MKTGNVSSDFSDSERQKERAGETVQDSAGRGFPTAEITVCDFVWFQGGVDCFISSYNSTSALRVKTLSLRNAEP